jgi:hypothetical protein
VIGLAGVMAILFSAQAAAAQGRTIEFAGGYQFLRFLENEGSNVATGWGASIASSMRNKIKIIGDAGGHYEDGNNLHTFQGGAEFGLGSNERAMPFVRLVTGLAASRMTATRPTRGRLRSVGIDVMVAVDWRLAAGFPIFRAEGNTESTFRLFVGVVIK